MLLTIHVAAAYTKPVRHKASGVKETSIEIRTIKPLIGNLHIHKRQDAALFVKLSTTGGT